jgi:Flp pilus assembly protein TadG
MSPMLISLVLGTVEFGRAFQQHHVMNKAMRDAGRFLARVPVECPSGASTGTVTNATDVTRAKNLALNGTPSGGTPRISYWNDPSTITVQVDCFDNTTGTYRGHSRIPLITVTATLPYQDIGFLDTLGMSAMTFFVRHQEMHIGE